MTLSLSRRSTNTTSLAESCSTHDNKTTCLQNSCTWLPESCNQYSNQPGMSDLTENMTRFRYNACKNDTGCYVPQTFCRPNPLYQPNFHDCELPQNQVSIDICLGIKDGAVNKCRWYFSCEGELENIYAGTCQAAAQPPGATATPTPPPGDPNTPCACDIEPFTGNTPDKSDDNFCHGYPATRNSCTETIEGPDGYCDSNRDGIVDGEGETLDGHTGWTLGWDAYEARCGHGGGSSDPTNTPVPPPTGSSPTLTLAPTPETIYPEANLTHNCSASQALWPAYDFHLTSINNITQFWKATFSFCLHPIGTYSPDLNVYNKDHTYLFMNFFERKATWISEQKIKKNVEGVEVDLPIWACYNLGGYTEIPGETGTNFINHFLNGNSYLGSTKTRADGTIYWPTVRELAEFTNNAIAEEKMSQFTEFIPKVVLAGFNGTEWRVNDQTILSRDTDGKGHMQLHTGLGTCAENIASTSPTLGPTTAPTCTYTSATKISKYLADQAGHRTISEEFALSDKVDKTKPIKIGVDWGWTGSVGDTQLGPVDLPGTDLDLDAGNKWQENEESKVDIFAEASGSADLTSLGTIVCPDVGEYKVTHESLQFTLFSDGRLLNFTDSDFIINTNLKDPKRDGGSWYTCPLIAGSAPLLSSVEAENERPASEFKEVTINSDTTKLKFEKVFTGDTEGNSTGSHFTRLIIQTCEFPEEP